MNNIAKDQKEFFIYLVYESLLIPVSRLLYQCTNSKTFEILKEKNVYDLIIKEVQIMNNGECYKFIEQKISYLKENYQFLRNKSDDYGFLLYA